MICTETKYKQTNERIKHDFINMTTNHQLTERCFNHHSKRFDARVRFRPSSFSSYFGNWNLFSSSPLLAHPQSAGYEYPKWYSGTIESPSRVAQHLKHNIRLQRQHQQQALFAKRGSALLATDSSVPGEPHFDGFGFVEALDNRVARLKCSFQRSFDQTDVSLLSAL